jgi:hypothetical protein
LPIVLLLVGCRGGETSRPPAAPSSSYQDLTALFTEWRAFQQPKLVDGVPDYTAPAMATQHRDLPAIQQRLAAIDPSGWPVPHQVDYQIVKAEMNGLDFDHRVLKPWAENPAFYVTVFPDQSDQPAREGPFAAAAVELWSHRFPLDVQAANMVRAGLAAVPKLLTQARTNLVGGKHDLWTYAVPPLKQQAAALESLLPKLGDDLKPLGSAAKAATDSFAAWVEGQAASMTAPSGVGIENYDWYLKNVLLLPYTWADEVALMRRELARAHSFLALEEERNRRLPQQVPVASAAEHASRFGAAVTEYMAFLKDRQIMTIKDYMDPALRARIGEFVPGPREFFTEVDYRDPVVMRTHGYHWFDLGAMAAEPHPDPIRRGPLLYNIFASRTEGWATAWEEMMLQAGMFDARPRSRELIYVLLGQRAARALGDLMMHANRFTLDQAAKFAVANTPRGWLRENAATVWFEQHLYLQQPAYGTSYLIGKIQGERLMMDRRRALGDKFSMKQFMDEFNAVGLIPISLVRWELTGDGSEFQNP